MKFCIFSGTFNPVHIAHLIIAQTVKEEIGADKILLIPAHIPPHRNIDIASAEHRMNMLKLATADNKDFEISDIEYRRDSKSYTYLTICELLKLHKNIDEKFHFIIGTDAFSHIADWYEAEKLVKLIKFVIIPREDDFNSFDFFEKINLKGIKREDIDYITARVPFMDVSSSYIRNRIKQGKSVKYLVNENVEEYIRNNNLFK